MVFQLARLARNEAYNSRGLVTTSFLGFQFDPSQLGGSTLPKKVLGQDTNSCGVLDVGPFMLSDFWIFMGLGYHTLLYQNILRN